MGIGVFVSFIASASDPEDGNLSSTIAWESDKDGALGTGGSLSLSNLSQGLHLITASATDTSSQTGSARTLLLVGSAPAAAEYTYNAFGQRVAKTDTATSTTVHFIYDPEGRVIAEIEAATGDTLREYIYLDGQQVAMVDDTDTVNEEMYFVHGDHLGTPRKITDDSQSVVWAADYEPFGKVTVTTDTIASSRDFNTRFPGQYADNESGLHYNYFRDYDPETGRYIESDPTGLRGGMNTYAYVKANPLKYVDPNGLNPALGCAIGSAAGPLGCAGGAIVGVVALGVAAMCAASNDDMFDGVESPLVLNEADGGDKALPAPGRPTEADGYHPPKNPPRNADKDGRVPNPNGQGKGWPDAKGDVWVPTGGKGAHGGDHWDVQTPGRGSRPGRHRNVMPGGRVR